MHFTPILIQPLSLAFLGDKKDAGLIAGIYIIRSKHDGKIYVGSAVNVTARVRIHRHHLRKQKHHSKFLQRSYNKYGEENFEVAVIEVCDKRKDALLESEQRWIDELKPGYNSRTFASTNLGIKFSDESRKRISDAQRGVKKGPMSPERLEQHRITQTGHSVSQKTRDKISAALKGRELSYTRSPETRAKLSASQKGVPRPYASGPQSDAHKAATAAGRAARSADQKTATAKKMSDALTGKPRSSQTRKKISESLKGRQSWWQIRGLPNPGKSNRGLP